MRSPILSEEGHETRSPVAFPVSLGSARTASRGVAQRTASVLARMLRRARGRLTVPFPRTQVLDVGTRLRGMCACQRVIAGRVPLHGEEVEAALIAEDVQLLGHAGAVPPAARSLSLAAREVEPTSRATGGRLPISPSRSPPRPLAADGMTRMRGRRACPWRGCRPNPKIVQPPAD
jgi:hypothetical protein